MPPAGAAVSSNNSCIIVVVAWLAGTVISRFSLFLERRVMVFLHVWYRFFPIACACDRSGHGKSKHGAWDFKASLEKLHLEEKSHEALTSQRIGTSRVFDASSCEQCPCLFR